MASYIRTEKGWRAHIYVNGVRTSKSFTTKSRAQIWATKMESEIRESGGGFAKGDLRTFNDLCNKYMDEVSVKKRGVRWESIRIRALQSDPKLSNKPLSMLTSSLLGEWRDDRLKHVSEGTVIREIGLLSGMFNTAYREWGVMLNNPMSGVRRPARPQPRNKLITQLEIDQFLKAIDFKEVANSTTKHKVAVAALFAIETAMRAGEILAIRREDINGRVVRLHTSKTGTGRDVPLSKRAIELLGLLGDDLFKMSSAVLDATFRRYRDQAELDFRFHDLRSLAVTNLAKKVDVLDLARIIGHSQNLRQLMVYYRKNASDIAEMLN